MLHATIIRWFLAAMGVGTTILFWAVYSHYYYDRTVRLTELEIEEQGWAEHPTLAELQYEADSLESRLETYRAGTSAVRLGEIARVLRAVKIDQPSFSTAATRQHDLIEATPLSLSFNANLEQTYSTLTHPAFSGEGVVIDRLHITRRDEDEQEPLAVTLELTFVSPR